jgi:predicted nucleic acid-binding protein
MTTAKGGGFLSFSKDYKIPMADGIIYATSIQFNCILWTQDKHFIDLDSVNYFEIIK